MVELLGALLAVLYLVFVTYRWRVAWVVCIASSLLYVPVFWSSQLYADAALQVYFVGMALYAWWSWSGRPEEVSVVRWTAPRHMGIIVVWLIATFVVGVALRHTPAGIYAFPDAFISIGSVIATVLTARRVIENWWYWIVINALATAVFAMKGLSLTALLYAAYAALSVRGLAAWREAAEKPETLPGD